MSSVGWSYTKDHCGQRFGRLVALERAASRGRRTMYLCRCDCGQEATVQAKHLRNGHTASCGCLQRQRTRESLLRHGAAVNGKESHEYNSWLNAKQRCGNPGHPRYPDYGARGIRMCERWRSDFAAFLADMGPCPPGLTLDRINNDGDYEPDNCRWATYTQQNGNRRVCRAKVEAA